ncbi:NADP-dependent 3-hydroxy acid dehydrogenase YdfG [Chitinivorax tropicus]|uniref:NADP-dependent 3-hydroxy acid dehydrogenase YdfG n=1 Tax=Chitinivorax tropicus TaxID=714531 RepID=A0A840MJ51_9PROT|nr:SDR family oxidoreductase [Chitinivorax tropicus]MBB5018440.1 NADP-dependent 3-hydroxy acid dehydrogenase YdfG [Chitinivorax tropicus]
MATEPDRRSTGDKQGDLVKMLQGKRIWITGASSGIGAATTRALADSGAELVLTARRENLLDSLAQEVAQAGGKALTRPVDVSDRAAMEALGKELATLGGVDILINNAGVMPLSPMHMVRVDEWERIIDVNLKGALYAMAAVLPGMKERKRGHIINLSSVAATVTFASAAVFCASKAGLRAVSDALRKEALHYGVRVTDIQPGAVATELPKSIRVDPIREEVTSKGGVWGPDAEILRPEDVASAIMFAISQPDHVDVSEILLRPRLQEH